RPDTGRPRTSRQRQCERVVDGSCRTMTKSSKIREIDLKPYQTHFLFQSAGTLTSKRIEQLLKELPTIIDDGLEDEDDPSEILAQSLPRAIKDEQIAWL